MGLPVVQRKREPSASEPKAEARPLPSSSGGQPLPAELRTRMEAAFGADFSAVRIHEDSRAADLGARALTQGTNIHFAPGEYQPDTAHGQGLIAHELAHVIQQAQGRVRTTPEAGGATVHDDPALEQEADERGARAARGEQAGVGGAGSPVAPAANNDGVAQPKWLDVTDKSYRVWDAVLDGKRWFQKLTSNGYQYASEPKDKSYPIKVFLTTRSWQGKLPRELTPTGVVFGTQNRDATEVEEAFRIGYHEFDTAESYNNIQEVAKGLSIARERREYRIIYKFDLRKEGENTQHLKLVAGLFHNFLDVAMVHNLPESSEQLSAAVKELNLLKEQNLIGKVGLSGVEPDHFKSDAIKGVDTIENDVEKPGTDEVTRKLCQERGIEYLGHGISHLIDESVQNIAQKHDTTATALIVAWAQSQNIRPLMSSSKTAQRTENARAWHTQVKPAAVEELSIYFSKKSSRSTKSIDDLPQAPSACEGAIDTFMKMTFLGNDEWNIARVKYVQMKDLMKFVKPFAMHIEQKVPPVEEVSSTYHGKTVMELLQTMLPSTNHCDRQKLFQAFVAGLRNT